MKTQVACTLNINAVSKSKKKQGSGANGREWMSEWVNDSIETKAKETESLFHSVYVFEWIAEQASQQTKVK